MACRLFGTKPLSEPMPNSALELLQSSAKPSICVQRLHFKTTTISPRGQWVNSLISPYLRSSFLPGVWNLSDSHTGSHPQCSHRMLATRSHGSSSHCIRPHLVNSTLQWRHHGRDSVSNHQPHDCLLSRVFRRRSKETSKLRTTGLCKGNSPLTGEFPTQRASNVENVSICWRHHEAESGWLS